MTQTFNEPVEFEAEVRHKVLPTVFVDKLQPSSVTPSVQNVTAFLAGGVLVTLTNFAKGQEGQTIRILGDGLTTVSHNANVKRIKAAAGLLKLNRVYEFILLLNVWYEVAGSGTLGDILVDFVIDGVGSVIPVGYAGELRVPAGDITSITLVADAALGTFVLDIWKDTYANIPLTVADTITAAAKPTMTNVRKYRDSTLTGWTKVIPDDSFLGFNVDTCTLYKRVTGAITIIGA